MATKFKSHRLELVAFISNMKCMGSVYSILYYIPWFYRTWSDVHHILMIYDRTKNISGENSRNATVGLSRQPCTRPLLTYEAGRVVSCHRGNPRELGSLRSLYHVTGLWSWFTVFRPAFGHGCLGVSHKYLHCSFSIWHSYLNTPTCQSMVPNK